MPSPAAAAEGHAKFPPHVLFRGEVEIDLDRASASHHVETHATDQRHVALHDRIPTFRHPRHRRPSCHGVKPQRGEAHVETLTRRANLGEMAVQFLPGFVQGFQRAAGQLQLARRFKRHRGRALLQPDRVLAVQDRVGAELAKPASTSRMLPG